MFRIDKNMTVYLTRGDACLLPVSCKSSGGEPYIFKRGETLSLRIFKKRRYDEVVFSKETVIAADTERAQIYLSSAETRLGEVINAPAEYWYEIELNGGTNAAQTIVGYDKGGPKVFRLYPECEYGKDMEEGEIFAVPSDPIVGYILDPDVIYGNSAYEIAVRHGFEGSESEWLDSLRRQIRGDAEEVIRTADAAYRAFETYSRKALENIEEAADSVLDIKQAGGESETAVMSQRAVTEMIGGCAGALIGTESGSAVRIDDISSIADSIKLEVSGVGAEDTVRVFSCGKNLAMVNSVTVPHVETVLFSGDITGSFCLNYKNRLGGKINPSIGIIKCVVDGEDRWVTGYANPPYFFSGRLTGVVICNWNGATEGSVDDIQLELGNVPTDFEPYVEGESILLSGGEGGAISAIPQSMTVYSDNRDATLTVEYSKDLRGVIEKLTNAIISLGGNI